MTVLYFLLFFCIAVTSFSVKAQAPISASKRATLPNHLKLNQIQVIGSHNSYKMAIDPPLFRLLKQTDSTMAKHIEYSHISIPEQLTLGLQNLEIDIYADAQGGKYAQPKGLEWEKNEKDVPPFDPEGLMKQPGFKVFHIQEIDFRRHVLTFNQCLQQLKAWSEANTSHLPIFITMNAKDEAIKRPGFTVPEKFTPAVFDELDKTILQTLGREKIIIPNDIRANHPTLESAVLAGNWPTLDKAKGKFIFILDETGEKRAAYIQNYPALKDRVLFANAEPGTPEAAFLILNNPLQDSTRIKEMVAKGYIVRTRADAETMEARQNDTRKFAAACRSGAQIITTDYYRKSTHFPSDYAVSFPTGTFARINPLEKTPGKKSAVGKKVSSK